jgi:hypothetical protein
MHCVFLLAWVYAEQLLNSFAIIPGTFFNQPDAVIVIQIPVNQIPALIHFISNVHQV